MQDSSGLGIIDTSWARYYWGSHKVSIKECISYFKREIIHMAQGESRVMERSSWGLGISIEISTSTCNQVVLLNSASESLKRDYTRT